MKKILLGIIVAVNLFAADPIQYGAYYGDIKTKVSNYYSYAENDASSAGSVYLYKQKTSTVNYIYDTKLKHIKNGLAAAKKYAIEQGSKYFAIDNVTHQVIVTEHKVYVLTHYNVLAFD